MSKPIKKAFVPKLRFPEFRDTGEWKEKSLGSSIEEFRKKSSIQDEFEVLTSARSGLIRQREYYDNDRITERDNIGFNIVPPNYLTYRSRSDDRRFYFNENNLSITGIISTYYPVFRVIEGNNKFFVELLSRYSTIVGKHSVGTSQTVLSLNELRRIKLPIPKEAEQQKIADCLSSLDELITTETQRLDTLKTHKKGLMQQLFPVEGETIPKLRFPEFREAEAWGAVTLEKASIPVTERVGQRKLIPVSISAGIGFIPQAEKFGRDISGNQYQLYTLVNNGDFVYNKGNSLKFPQGCIYLLQGWEQVAAPNVFICFRLKDGYSNAFFQNCFEQNLHGKQLKKHITSGARSNGLLNISKENFFGIEVPIPSLLEQQKIADCLSSLDDLVTTQTQRLDALKTKKKGLMQQLFPVMDEVSE